MVESIDARYLAGLFDGEGTIAICCMPYLNTIKVGLCNTYKPVVEMLHKEFGGSLSHRHEGEWKDGCIRQQLYQWDLSGSGAAKFLQKCQPFLVIKKDQCKVALALYASTHTGPANINRELTDAEMLRRLTFWLILYKLKHGMFPKR